MKKILGIIAIVGIGALVYSQYRKAKDEKKQIKLSNK
jgi:hypothetical protein